MGKGHKVKGNKAEKGVDWTTNLDLGQVAGDMTEKPAARKKRLAGGEIDFGGRQHFVNKRKDLATNFPGLGEEQPSPSKQ